MEAQLRSYVLHWWNKQTMWGLHGETIHPWLVRNVPREASCPLAPHLSNHSIIININDVKQFFVILSAQLAIAVMKHGELMYLVKSNFTKLQPDFRHLLNRTAYREEEQFSDFMWVLKSPAYLEIPWSPQDLWTLSTSPWKLRGMVYQKCSLLLSFPSCCKVNIWTNFEW